MPSFKGGRGYSAPYETTHVRVPVPIKFLVEKLIDDYRDSLITGSQFEPNFLTFSEEKLKQIAEQVIAEARVRDRAEVRRRLSSFIERLLSKEPSND